jgi:hypothetical protein
MNNIILSGVKGDEVMELPQVQAVDRWPHHIFEMGVEEMDWDLVARSLVLEAAKPHQSDL